MGPGDLVADRLEIEAWRRSFLENLPDHASTLALAEAWRSGGATP